jgi:uncharacterized membrane protein (DUF441 family)
VVASPLRLRVSQSQVDYVVALVSAVLVAVVQGRGVRMKNQQVYEIRVHSVALDWGAYKEGA